MKTFSLTLRTAVLAAGFILIAIMFANAQTNTSSMYDSKCRLKHDSTLSISKALCETWSYAENNIAAHLSHLEIPKEYLENGFKARHAVIASFECDSADVSNVKVLNDTTGYADAVKNCIKSQGKKIAAELKQSSKKTESKKFMGKYYVAFNIMLMNFNQQLKNAKAVPIIRSTTPMMDMEQ
jgi:hypothetical protein